MAIKTKQLTEFCKICKQQPCTDPEFRHLCQLCGVRRYPEDNKRFRWCMECVVVDKPLPQIKEPRLTKCVYKGCGYLAEWRMELETHYRQAH
jgi:hypothetical protein